MLNRILVSIAQGRVPISERCLRVVFAIAADVAWLFGIGGVRQLERNLSHVPDQHGLHRSHHELRRLSRRNMHAYFDYFVEAMTVGSRDRAQLLARVRGDGDGLASLVELINANPGAAPLAMGHQGNWDYAGLWAHDALAPVTTIAERLDDAALLNAFVSIREQLGITVVLTGQSGLVRRLEQALGQPHVLVPLLADRDLSANGEFVQAFDSVIRVARGPATLAYDMELPLYVANIYRERLHGDRRRLAGSRHGYVVQISGPVDIDRYRSWRREPAIRAISQAWVDVWSRGIAANPQDWHMLQPLFLEDLDLRRLHDVPDDIAERAEQLRRHGRK